MKKKFNQGTTLIELITAISIISIVIVGLLVLTSQSTQRSSDPLITEQAIAIAQSYQEEIQQKRFCDPDWDHDGVVPNDTDCPIHCTVSACSSCSLLGTGWTVETRSTYDNVCDYNALNEVPTDQNANAIANLGQYTVVVQVIDDAGANIGVAGNVLNGNSGQVVRVNVTVTHPSMDLPIVLSSYRANF